MRAILSPELERHRIRVGPMATPAGSLFGLFQREDGLTLISSGPRSLDHLPESSWEHVSASFPSRCPTWNELAWIKRAFWSDEETVIQIHPPEADYVNVHPYCLHLWKPPYRVELPPRSTMAPGKR